MIYLKTLQIEDFRSYANETLNFSQGKNVILGDNGSGKTTILLAILYALFGKVRRLDKSIPLEQLYRKGKDKFKLQLSFTIDGAEYEILRENFKGNKEPVAKLWKNGTLIAEKQNTVTNEVVNLLKIDETTFENVVYIGQGEISSIVQQTPGQRKLIFDQFLDLDVYERVYKNLKDVEKNTESEVKSLESQIKILSDDVKDLPAEEIKLQENKEKLKIKKDEEISIEKEFKVITDKFNEENKKAENILLLKRSVDEKNNQLNLIDSKIIGLKSAIEKDVNQKIELNLAHLQKTLEAHQALKEQYEKSVSDLDHTINEQEKMEIEIKSIDTHTFDFKQQMKQTQDTITQSKDEISLKIQNFKEMPFGDWKGIIKALINESKNKTNELQIERKNILNKEKIASNYKAELITKNNIIKKFEEDLLKKKTELKNIDPDWEKIINDVEMIQYDKVKEDVISKYDDLNKKFNELNNEKLILINKNKELNEELDRLKKLEEGYTCPQCKQLVSADHKKMIINEVNSQLKNTKQKMQDIEKTLEPINKDLKQISGAIESLNERYTKYIRIKPIHALMLDITEQTKTEILNKKTLEDKIDTLEIPETSDAYDKKIDEETNKSNSYNLILEKINNIEGLNKSLTDIEKKIKQLTNNKESIQKNYDKKKLDEARNLIKDIKNKLQIEIKLVPELKNIIERLNEKNILTSEIEALRKTLAGKVSEFDENTFQELKNQRELIIRKIGAIKSEIKSLSEVIIPSIESNINNLKAKCKELESDIQEIRFQKAKNNIIILLRSFTREITPILRAQKINRISDKATEIFLQFIGHSGEFDGIHISENYDLYVKRYGALEELNLLSGGEQVIACLAIRLAISELLANQGLILLDEPTAHLDDKHIVDLVSVFELYSPVNQMISVTHDKEFEKISDSLIMVYKNKGESSIL